MVNVFQDKTTKLVTLLLLTFTACGQAKEKTQKVVNKTAFDTTEKQNKEMSDYSPTITKAHPNAKRLLNAEFYFNPVDENSPFGNDDGADAYAGFADWRKTHKGNSPKEYFIEKIKDWNYPTFDYNETNFENLKPYIKQSQIAFRTLTGSDAAIIAIVFGQLYLEGTIDKDFKELAKTTIKRELIPEVMQLWGNPYGIEELKPKLSDPAIIEREKKLKEMLAVLNQVD